MLRHDIDVLSRAIIIGLQEHVSFPGLEELDNLRGSFGKEFPLHDIVYVVDCSHAPVWPPRGGSSTDNRTAQAPWYCFWKKIHSIKVLCACDWKGRILFYDVHGQLPLSAATSMRDPLRGRIEGVAYRPGQLSDQLHWNASALSYYGGLGKLDQRRHRGMSDAGFKSSGLLMPMDMGDYKKLEAMGGDVEYCKRVDRSIAEVRVIIEGVFGALKNAWPLFRAKLHARANRDKHGRQLQAALHLFNYRCSQRGVWLRDLHWRAGAPEGRPTWEVAMLEKMREMSSSGIDISNAAVAIHEGVEAAVTAGDEAGYI
jgi:hypothetical protein